jgi:hypothetical protein
LTQITDGKWLKQRFRVTLDDMERSTTKSDGQEHKIVVELVQLIAFSPRKKNSLHFLLYMIFGKKIKFLYASMWCVESS